MEVIKSLENKLVKNWTKLKQKKYRDEQKVFIVEGQHLVQEAIKAGLVKEIIMQEDKTFNTGITCHLVTKEILSKISSLESSPDIMAVVSFQEKHDITSKIIMVDGIQDPGNLGTIIRSAVAFGFKTIIIGNNTVDIYNDKTLRATQGMLFHINIIKSDLKEIIPKLKNENYKIYGTKVDGGKKIKDISKEEKIAFIVGNEGSGIEENILGVCDEYLYIPINSLCESLNVAIASSIILYELGDHHE